MTDSMQPPPAYYSHPPKGARVVNAPLATVETICRHQAQGCAILNGWSAPMYLLSFTSTFSTTKLLTVTAGITDENLNRQICCG